MLYYIVLEAECTSIVAMAAYIIPSVGRFNINVPMLCAVLAFKTLMWRTQVSV